MMSYEPYFFFFLLTSKPQRLLDKSAHMNDCDKPNNRMLEIVPIKPVKITGLLPIRSDSIPQWIPFNLKKKNLPFFFQ
jgi:hypothetical protein